MLQSFSGTDGANPFAGLIFDAAGNLYGTTTAGGASHEGAVFEVTSTSSSSVSIRHHSSLPADRHTPDRRADSGGSFRTFPIPQEGGCNIPATATAYSLNVTVVPMGFLGYITMWPAGIDLRPVVSTLNSPDGRIKANAAIVPAGTNGGVNVYATNTTNVILDINGYFAPVRRSTLEFYPLPPCRVADTRDPSKLSQRLGAAFADGRTAERDFPILNATSCNIPSSAAAYSLNLTVVPHGTLGYLTVWPTGQNRPTVSTLNDVLGNVIANAAIVVAGTGNDVSAYATNDTDLIIDINGYFAPAGDGRVVALYGGALPGHRHAPCRQRAALQRDPESSGECGR